MYMSILKVQDVSQAFFTKKTCKVILDEVNLELKDGELISFLGPSGCGKSTLLSIICGMLKPIQGQVEFEGKIVDKPDGHIGYMLQQDFLYPWLTVEENICLGLKIRKRLTDDNRAYVYKLLDAVGLKDAMKQMPCELSGGMRQRVALVRTMATKPKLLLLDEPFSALDYQTKIKLEKMVFSLLKEMGKSAILVTHDIEEAIATSDRILLFGKNPGQVIQEFVIQEEIRATDPLEARGLQSFHENFHQIWKEMERIETRI